MAKTPPPSDGPYVPLTATIDERECRDNQRACRGEVDGIIGRIFKELNEKVSWTVMGVLLAVVLGVIGVIYARQDVHSASISNVERTAETLKGDIRTVSEIVSRVEKTLAGQADAFEALRREIQGRKP